MIQVIGTCSRWKIFPRIGDRYSAVLQPPLSASVSAAKVDYTTLLTLLEFHISGQHLLWKSVRKIIWPLWLTPSGRLLKLASVYKASLIVFGSRLGKRIWFFSFLTCFTTLFSSITSWIFMLLTLVLTFQVLKLISGLEIPDNQLSWLANDRTAEMSSCGTFRSFSVSWSVSCSERL